jgi:hypothetical protein
VSLRLTNAIQKDQKIIKGPPEQSLAGCFHVIQLCSGFIKRDNNYGCLTDEPIQTAKPDIPRLTKNLQKTNDKAIHPIYTIISRD